MGPGSAASARGPRAPTDRDTMRGGPIMADVRSRFLWFAGAVALLWLATPHPGAACPFCSEEKGPTLVGDFNQASLVLYGTFANYKPNTGNEFGGTTDFLVEKVLKPHAILKG